MTNLVCNWEEKMRYYNKSMDNLNNRNRSRRSKMNEYEKKSYMQSFIESIELYPKNGTKRGTTVKTIHFRFPVSYKGESVYEVSLPKEPTIETVVLMSKVNLDK